MNKKTPATKSISCQAIPKLNTRHKDLSDAEHLADFQLSSEALAVLVMQSREKNLYGNGFELGNSIHALQRANQRIADGKLEGIEEALFSQAKALEALFTASVRTAMSQQGLVQYKAHMNFALKAQAQSRATLQALIQLKQPHKSVFVTQANIAHGHQQINNPASQEKTDLLPNELLEKNHGKAHLDSGATHSTESSDSHLAAMETVDRR